MRARWCAHCWQGSGRHLAANTIPFLVLGTAIALSGLARIAAVTVIVAVVGGLGTWLTAPAATVHIGASGLVFGLAPYLIMSGAYSRRALHDRRLRNQAPIRPCAHAGRLVTRPAFGAMGGGIAAWLLHRASRRA